MYYSINNVYVWCIIIFCISVLLYILLKFYKKTQFKSKQFYDFLYKKSQIKNTDKIIKNPIMIKNTESIVPLDVYQTWHTKNIPFYMKKCIENMKKLNPEFTFHLYDNDDCAEFIKNNFDKSDGILDAFNNLIPGAYKADLWRYCVLYKKGGIYLDIKYECKNGFKLIQLADKERYVLERDGGNFWKEGQFGIYNAFIISKPSNYVLWKCIKQIVENVKNKNYSVNSLYPTGPGLLGEIYFNNVLNDVYDFDLFYVHPEKIIYKNIVILQGYPEYRSEQQTTQSVDYHKQWATKKIYK